MVGGIQSASSVGRATQLAYVSHGNGVSSWTAEVSAVCLVPSAREGESGKRRGR